MFSAQFLLEVARQKNLTPLPLIKPYTGPRLPPDRYCLTAPNYRLKVVHKKVTPPGSRSLYEGRVVCTYFSGVLPSPPGAP